MRLWQRRRANGAGRIDRPGRREAVEGPVGYLDRHWHRMGYPEYLAHGRCIGGGAVERAREAVVGQRLKLAGRRRGEGGAHAGCHLRALSCGEESQWDVFWSRGFSLN